MYDVIDCPGNGTAGQHCGAFALGELPARLRAAVLADPAAGEWTLPALSEGDSGEELDGLTVVVRRIAPDGPEGWDAPIELLDEEPNNA